MQIRLENHSIPRSRSLFSSAALQIGLCAIVFFLASPGPINARTTTAPPSDTESPAADTQADFERRLRTLEAEVAELKRLLAANTAAAPTASPAGSRVASPAPSEGNTVPAKWRLTWR